MLTPPKAGQCSSVGVIYFMQHASHLLVLWKNICVDDLVQVFLVEIIDRKTVGDRRIQPVGSGDVVIKSYADKNSVYLGRRRYLT